MSNLKKPLTPERPPASTANLEGKPYEKRNVFQQIKVRAVDRTADDDERLYRRMPGGGGRGGPGGGGGRGGGGRDYRRPTDTKGTVTRLMGYVATQPAVLIMVFVLMAMGNGGSLLSSYLVKPLLDDFIIPNIGAADKDYSGLARQLALMGCVYIGTQTVNYIYHRTMMRLAQWSTNRIRGDLFSKLQRLPISYFDTHTHGELMSRFTNDTDTVQMMLENSFVNLISGIISFCATVVLMLSLNWRMFLITACSIGLSTLLVKTTSNLSRIMFKNQQSNLGNLNGYIEELVEGLKVVKAFNYEERSKRDFDLLDAEYREDAKLANFIGMFPQAALGALMNITYAITAVAGAFMIINDIRNGSVNPFTLGSLMVYLNYSRQVAQPINMMSNQVVNILSAIAGAERVFRVMNTEPEIDEGNVTLVAVELGENGVLTERADGKRTGYWAWKIPLPIEDEPGAPRAEGDGYFEYREVRGDVRFIDVDFSYIPGVPVLKKISVYAKPGQKIAFVGSTGAGKTTITNLINRFYEIDGGQITFDGIDVRDIRKSALRQSLGIVLQDITLFTGTVMENIRYGDLEATDEDCIEAAKSANAHGFIMRLPDGYQTMITGNGQNLSQGQRQLLAIARTAVAKHPVMILDEATSSIDTRTEKQIERGMDALMENKTVFVIAHRLSTVRNSKAIAVIEHGEIIEKGNHEELLAQEGRYYLLYTGQHELD